MGSYLVESDIQSRSESILSVLKDVDLMLSYFPYQVERGKKTVKDSLGEHVKPTITLRFKRFGLFTFKDVFIVDVRVQTQYMITYILKSERGNLFEILFTLKENRVTSKTLVHIAIKYDGEKEWIVKKFLADIGKALLDGIKKEAGKVIETKISINNDFSQQLNKISFISKLLLKSKLINSKKVVINRGNSLGIITDLIEEYLGKYKAIYVSGTSSQSSFRLLFIDGDLKGVYVNLNGEEHFDEKSLNSLEGEFKVNVYVVLVPQLLGLLDENP